MQVSLKNFNRQMLKKLSRNTILSLAYLFRFCLKCQKQVFSYKKSFLVLIIIVFAIFSYSQLTTNLYNGPFKNNLLGKLFYQGQEVTIESGLPSVSDKIKKSSDQDFKIAAWREHDISNLSEESEIALILGNSALVAPETEINENDIPRKTRSEIEIYIVQSGDNPWDIANKFELNVWTVLWANNLTYWRANIQPGDKLKILPVDGILHEVKKDENTSYLAKKYKVSTEKIIEFNNLDKNTILNPGQIIIIPDGTPPPVPKPIYKPSATTPLFVATEKNDCSYTDWRYKRCYSICKRYYWKPGQCTDWVAYKWATEQGQCVGPSNWGNAKTWLQNAKNDGFKIAYTPQKGAIVALNCNNWYGHVAYIEDFDDDYIYISEMNGPSNPSWTQKPATRKLKRTLDWQNTSQGSWQIRGYIMPQ